MDVKTFAQDIISKARVANIVSAICVLTGVVFTFQTGDIELAYLLTGAGIGYLLKGDGNA